MLHVKHSLLSVACGLFVYHQVDKRAALQELEAVQLKQLASRFGQSTEPASQQESNQVCLSALML